MIILKKFPFKKQKTLSTCGEATLRMISCYLGKNIEEKKLPNIS